MGSLLARLDAERRTARDPWAGWQFSPWRSSWPRSAGPPPESPSIPASSSPETIGRALSEYAAEYDEWLDDVEQVRLDENVAALAGDLYEPDPPRLFDLLPSFRAERGGLRFVMPPIVEGRPEPTWTPDYDEFGIDRAVPPWSIRDRPSFPVDRSRS